MRKQYYFRPSEHGLLAWDVDRLVQLSSDLPRLQIALSELRELDEGLADDSERLTWRTVVEHMKLIEEADLAYPIILSATGAVMDGRHRVAKALLEGRERIEAVRFAEDPPPDHIGRGPDALPY